jgi:hypothetical protein
MNKIEHVLTCLAVAKRDLHLGDVGVLDELDELKRALACENRAPNSIARVSAKCFLSFDSCYLLRTLFFAQRAPRGAVGRLGACDQSEDAQRRHLYVYFDNEIKK